MHERNQIILRYIVALFVGIVITGSSLNLTKNSANQIIRFRILFTTIDNIRLTDSAIKEYRQRHGALPHSLSQLTADAESPLFDKNGRTLDFWNNPLVYKVHKDSYVLMSYGRRRKAWWNWF